MTKRLVREYLTLEDELQEQPLDDVIAFLRKVRERHEGLPENMTFSISEWAGLTYQRWETDTEENIREEKEAREKAQRYLQYLNLKEEFENDNS